jgi:hypothetical protein
MWRFGKLWDWSGVRASAASCGGDHGDAAALEMPLPVELGRGGEVTGQWLGA